MLTFKLKITPFWLFFLVLKGTQTFNIYTLREEHSLLTVPEIIFSQ